MSVQMCAGCGAKFTAPTPLEAWALLDQHCDTQHGRRFRSTVIYDMDRHPSSRRANKRAPLTDQGGR